MAKSIRSKAQKRFRAEQRGTTGAKYLAKTLRKTTRVMLKHMQSTTVGQANVDDLRKLLSGAGGASAGLVTTEPIKKKKLRHTFNTSLRAHRLDAGLEDETDDEAEEVIKASRMGRSAVTAEGAEEEEGKDGEQEMDGGGGGDATTTKAAAAGFSIADKIEISGMHKSTDKPAHKRKMSSQTYEWQMKDLVNPNVPGAYDVIHKPSSSRQRWIARNKKGKKGGKKEAVVGL